MELVDNDKNSKEIEALIESEPMIQDQSEIKSLDSNLDMSIESKLKAMMPALV